MGGNAYEEARNLNILQNRKKLEEFGLPKTLGEADSQKKQRTPKPKDIQLVEPRRSSRPRNTVSYSDDLDIGLPPLRKKSRTNSSSRGSSDEFNLASYEERARAIKAAEELQTSLQSQNPSFVKSMVRSHVYSCFWLGLPSEFCKTHLSKSTVEMVLEDGNGKEFAATYIDQRVGLSGGWRAFALEHKLDDGDALVFELIEPTRFKIYITRFSSISSQEHNAKVVNKEVTGAEKTSKGAVNSQSYQTLKSKEANLCASDDLTSPQEPQPQNGNGKVVNKEVTGAQKTSKGAVNSVISDTEVKGSQFVWK